jgi:hypothetical protein
MRSKTDKVQFSVFYRKPLPVSPIVTGSSAGSDDGMHYIITDRELNVLMIKKIKDVTVNPESNKLKKKLKKKLNC